MSIIGPGHLRVTGGEFEQVLLDTLDARKIEFRDKFGDLHTLVYRHSDEDVWCMVNKNDPDWDAQLIRMGYRQSGQDIRDMIRSTR